MSIVIILFMLSAFANTNFVNNGDFENPQISPTASVICATSISGWRGSFDLIGPLSRQGIINPTQSADIACDDKDGWIAQNVFLPADGFYQLFFKVEQYNIYP